MKDLSTNDMRPERSLFIKVHEMPVWYANVHADAMRVIYQHYIFSRFHYFNEATQIINFIDDRNNWKIMIIKLYAISEIDFFEFFWNEILKDIMNK